MRVASVARAAADTARRSAPLRPRPPKGDVDARNRRTRRPRRLARPDRGCRERPAACPAGPEPGDRSARSAGGRPGRPPVGARAARASQAIAAVRRPGPSRAVGERSGCLAAVGLLRRAGAGAPARARRRIDAALPGGRSFAGPPAPPVPMPRCATLHARLWAPRPLTPTTAASWTALRVLNRPNERLTGPFRRKTTKQSRHDTAQ